jgi:hypothetical protein
MTAITSFGLSPSEFWSLHPQEFWWIVESKAPHLFEEPQRKRLLRLLEEGFNNG